MPDESKKSLSLETKLRAGFNFVAIICLVFGILIFLEILCVNICQCDPSGITQLSLDSSGGASTVGVVGFLDILALILVIVGIWLLVAANTKSNAIKTLISSGRDESAILIAGKNAEKLTEDDKREATENEINTTLEIADKNGVHFVAQEEVDQEVSTLQEQITTLTEENAALQNEIARLTTTA